MTWHIHATSNGEHAIRSAPAFPQLLESAGVELHTLDLIALRAEGNAEIVAHCLRRTAALATRRGELLIFIDPDAVYADDSLRRVHELALSGAGAVAIARPRASRSAAAASLERARPAGRGCPGAISSRRLMRLWLENLHPDEEAMFLPQRSRGAGFVRSSQAPLHATPSRLYWRVAGCWVLARAFALQAMMVRPKCWYWNGLSFERIGEEASDRANEWDYSVTLSDGVGSSAPQVQGGDASGKLFFNADGRLEAVTNAGSTYPVSVTLTSLPAGVSAQTVLIDFGPAALTLGGTSESTSQYAETDTTNSFLQDGFGAGSLQSIGIDREGFVTGQFSNGESVNLAQVALANFSNVEGLLSVGNNASVESRLSGQPLIGAPETGNFGSIRSSSLEQSSVDLAAQFVRMIINQRAFQANTRAISVTNELLANLVSLGG